MKIWICSSHPHIIRIHIYSKFKNRRLYIIKCKDFPIIKYAIRNWIFLRHFSFIKPKSVIRMVIFVVVFITV